MLPRWLPSGETCFWKDFLINKLFPPLFQTTVLRATHGRTVICSSITCRFSVGWDLLMCLVSPGELKKVEGQCLHVKICCCSCCCWWSHSPPPLSSLCAWKTSPLRPPPRVSAISSSLIACHSRCLSLISTDGKRAPHRWQRHTWLCPELGSRAWP